MTHELWLIYLCRLRPLLLIYCKTTVTCPEITITMHKFKDFKTLVHSPFTDSNKIIIWINSCFFICKQIGCSKQFWHAIGIAWKSCSYSQFRFKCTNHVMLDFVRGGNRTKVHHQSKSQRFRTVSHTGPVYRGSIIRWYEDHNSFQKYQFKPQFQHTCLVEKKVFMDCWNSWVQVRN